MGYKISGYRFSLQQSFLSIPGLILWIAPPKLISFDNVLVGASFVDKVRTAGSLSPDSFTYTTQDYGNYRKPVLVSNYFTGYEGSSLSALLRRTDKDAFKCLQDGSANGVYYISSHNEANTNSIASPVSVSNNLTVSSTVTPGIRICTEIDTATRRRVYKQITDGSSTLIYNSRTLNAIIDSISGFAKVSYGFLNTGNGNANNEKLYANNTLLAQHTNTAYYNANPSLSADPILMMGVRHPGVYKDIRNYLAIAYNWTGYNEAQVITFDSQVRQLLEIAKTQLI